MGTDGDTQCQGRTPIGVWAPSLLTSSFTPALVSLFSLASLASFSVSLTSCLMNPPGMTERSRGGVDGGGPLSSSRICGQEHRLGYRARCRDRTPGKAALLGTLVA